MECNVLSPLKRNRKKTGWLGLSAHDLTVDTKLIVRISFVGIQSVIALLKSSEMKT